MHVIVNLIDLIELIFAGAVLAILVLYIIVCLIGYGMSQLIKWIQERLWKK